MCLSCIGNGGKHRRAERCDSFLGGCGCLQRAIKLKLPGMLSDGDILLYDNAHLHTDNLVRDRLQRFGWETHQHPPYSPDLPLVTSTFFATRRKTFVDVGFNRTRKCKSGWDCGSVSDLFYETGIDRLISQWDKCINTSGNYFWIKQISLSLCSGCSVFIWLPLIHLQGKIKWLNYWN